MPLVQRYTGVAQGAMVLTGNTITTRLNIPFPPATGPQIFQAGAYITTTQSLQAPGYPMGTTLQYTQNSSMAILNVVPGSKVLFAQLMWTFRNEPPGTENNPVNFTTPAGTTPVTPTLSDSTTILALNWRAADVKTLVQAGIDAQPANAQYIVGAVPGLSPPTGTAVSVTWGLIVVYENAALPFRYFNVNTGAEFVSATQQLTFNFTNFATPSQGPIKGYLLMTYTDGDIEDAAELRVGAAAPGTQIGNSSYPWNGLSPYSRINNMFPGNILNADTEDPNIGLLDTRGTFGTLNLDPYGNGGTGSAPPAARNLLDLDGYDISPQLVNGQTTLYTNITFGGIGSATSNSQSVQIDINSAKITPVKAVDKATAFVGESVKYTITLPNTGAADAQNVVVTDIIPAGLTFVPGSVTINGVATPGANPALGIFVGTIAKATTTTVTFRGVVRFIPIVNPVVNTADVIYSFESVPGQPLLNVNTNSNSVNTQIIAGAAIEGVVFNDVNHSGSYDSGDTGIPNAYVVMQRPDATCKTLQTDSDGKYIFTGLLVAGTYNIYETAVNPGATCPPTTFGQPPGFTQSTTFRTAVVTITQNDIDNGIILSGGDYGHDNPAIFSCLPVGYQVNQPASNSNSAFQKINLVTGNITTLKADVGYVVNAIGYNSLNNMIYGFESGTANLLRIAADGTTTYIGTVANLPVPLTVGTIDAAGHLYVYNTSAAKYYVIDIDQNSPTFGKLVNPTTAFTPDVPPYGVALAPAQAISDWSFNAADSQIYAMENVAGNVVRINPLTGVSTVLTTTGASAGTYDSQFMDFTGNIYTVDKSTGKLYRAVINGNNASVQLFTTSQPTGVSDGTMCPTASVRVDFGDAPDTVTTMRSASNYATLLIHDGPRHQIVSSLRLGTQITAELDALQNANATGDDLGAGIQDDGVQVPIPNILTCNKTYSLDVTCTNPRGFTGTAKPANLYAWIDFNQDGIFEGSEAAPVTIVPINTLPTTYKVTFNVPSNVLAGNTFLRIRLTTDELINANSSASQVDTRSIGPASDGEVEDYIINVVATSASIVPIKAADKNYANIGDTIHYTVAIPNTSAEDAYNLVFKDILPAGLTMIYGSFSVNGNTILNPDLNAGVPLGNLPAGRTTIVAFSAQVDNDTTLAGKVLNNQAFINFEFCTGVVQTVATNIVPVTITNIDLTVVKSASADIVKIGDTLTFTIDITNTGSVELTNVTVTDPIPQNTTFIPDSVTINGVTQPGLNPETGINIGTLSPGKAVKLSFSVIVDKPDCNSSISNVANVSYQYRINQQYPIITETKESNVVVVLIALAAFKQLSRDENLIIPHQKPDIEEILNTLVEVEILKTRVIPTMAGLSIEGQKLTGKKLIIEGRLNQKVEYIAKNSRQSVHAAHFMVLFSTYIIMPNDFVDEEKLFVDAEVEDVYTKKIDERTLFKNVTFKVTASYRT